MATFLLKLLVLASLLGFSVNLACDPIHEFYAENGAHMDEATQPIDHASPSPLNHDFSGSATCRVHCHAAHKLVWFHNPDLFPTIQYPSTLDLPLYQSRFPSGAASELLRPPTVLAFA